MLADAAGHGIDHLRGRQRQQIFAERGDRLRRAHERIGQKLVHKLFAYAGGVHRLADKILEIQHLGAAGAKLRCKGVVLLCALLEIGDVVKKLALQICGNQVFKLTAGSVQQNLLERAHLGSDMNGRMHPTSSCLYGYLSRKYANMPSYSPPAITAQCASEARYASSSALVRYPISMVMTGRVHQLKPV